MAVINFEGNSFWYDQCGDGDPLVVLHPGLVDARAFARLLSLVALTRSTSMQPKCQGSEKRANAISVGMLGGIAGCIITSCIITGCIACLRREGRVRGLRCRGAELKQVRSSDVFDAAVGHA